VLNGGNTIDYPHLSSVTWSNILKLSHTSRYIDCRYKITIAMLSVDNQIMRHVELCSLTADDGAGVLNLIYPISCRSGDTNQDRHLQKLLVAPLSRIISFRMTADLVKNATHSSFGSTYQIKNALKGLQSCGLKISSLNFKSATKHNVGSLNIVLTS
jgi:hypothetical protein